jgi:hypothetical protein
VNDANVFAMVRRCARDRREQSSCGVPAASASQMGRFETCWLTAEKNLSALANLSGQCIDRIHRRRSPRNIVLDMNSSVTPMHGEQEKGVSAILCAGRIDQGQCKSPDRLQRPVLHFANLVQHCICDRADEVWRNVDAVDFLPMALSLRTVMARAYIDTIFSSKPGNRRLIFGDQTTGRSSCTIYAGP